mmetsp:Transcript_100582/g.284923  ORF Transcript_100582/g.284923 Transcript_100582/m.284923 type:complete len:266 (+) Transcript_100582:113-910(+)
MQLRGDSSTRRLSYGKVQIPPPRNTVSVPGILAGDEDCTSCKHRHAAYPCSPSDPLYRLCRGIVAGNLGGLLHVGECHLAQHGPVNWRAGWRQEQGSNVLPRLRPLLEDHLRRCQQGAEQRLIRAGARLLVNMEEVEAAAEVAEGRRAAAAQGIGAGIGVRIAEHDPTVRGRRTHAKPQLGRGGQPLLGGRCHQQQQRLPCRLGLRGCSRNLLRRQHQEPFNVPCGKVPEEPLRHEGERVAVRCSAPKKQEAGRRGHRGRHARND